MCVCVCVRVCVCELVCGSVSVGSSGTITSRICRDPKRRLLYTSLAPDDDAADANFAKYCSTEYEVLNTKPGLAQVLFRPLTGRCVMYCTLLDVYTACAIVRPTDHTNCACTLLRRHHSALARPSWVSTYIHSLTQSCTITSFAASTSQQRMTAV